MFVFNVNKLVNSFVQLGFLLSLGTLTKSPAALQMKLTPYSQLIYFNTEKASLHTN